MRAEAVEIKNRILEAMDLSRDISDEELELLIEEEVAALCRRSLLTLDERINMQRDIFNSLRRMDVLSDLLEDDSITEIMIDGPGKIYIEQRGRITLSDKHFSDEDKLSDVIQQIVGAQNRIVNETTPIVDTRLADGSRVNVVLPPIAIDGAAISIRKFPKDPFTMDQLIGIGSISVELAEFLRVLVEAGYNIFVSGGTGSGKTTFLNVLSNFIPKDERIITIEDSAELQIKGVGNLVRLETRNANLDGKFAIAMRDLIKSALRMRPDRIIVGECRGEEALDMLQAMNTGHDGSLSTGHANSCRDMIARLETMVLMGMELPLPAIRSQIASGIDIIVHLSRLRDRSRKLVDVAEVTGMKEGEVQLNTLYHFEETGMKDGRIEGRWKKTGELKNTTKLQQAGLSI